MQINRPKYAHLMWRNVLFGKNKRVENVKNLDVHQKSHVTDTGYNHYPPQD